jgi:hypothetical protein
MTATGSSLIRLHKQSCAWERSIYVCGELMILGKSVIRHTQVCRMPVEMIIDQCNPSRCRYRTETFCYGPRSCPLYQAGPARKVPGRRRGMTYTEEDWVDDEATSHRRLEE